MTIREIQRRLKNMGLYSGALDGIVGDQTLAALAEAIPDTGTGDAWNGIKWFHPSETVCRCGCGGNDMRHEVLAAADNIRTHFAAPVNISSGYRCAAHNAEVGGVSNSRHLTGEALDFTVAGADPAAVLDYAWTIPGIKYAYRISGGAYIHINI